MILNNLICIFENYSYNHYESSTQVATLVDEYKAMSKILFTFFYPREKYFTIVSSSMTILMIQ